MNTARTTLPNSKFAVPQRTQTYFPRPRLIERLDAGLEMKLTVIKGPAGFGKTSLVAEWAGQKPEAAVWITIDEDDNDPIHFLTSLVHGVRRIDGQIGKAVLDVLESISFPPVDDIVTLFANELGNINRDLVIVLDDCHLIQSEGAQQVFSRFIQFMPLQAHMVMISRKEPALPLARLRVDQQLNEIDAEDLKLNPDETRQYLRDIVQTSLQDDSINTLHQLTEGWIAGLCMAAFSLLRCDNPEEFIQNLSGADRDICDYLDEEVFGLQPDHIKDFLIQTAVLESFNASLCEALTGRDDSSEILRALDDANLFVFPLDNTRNEYRYHRFFADVLKARLERTHPEIVPDLYRRAGDWCRRSGLPETAVKYALAGGQYEAAADIMTELADVMVQRREYRLLGRWFDLLPEETALKRPFLAIYRVHVLVEHSRFMDAGRSLDTLEKEWSRTREKMDIDPDQETLIDGGIMALKGLLAFTRFEFDQSWKFSHQALEQLDDRPCTFTLLAMTSIAFTCYFEERLDEAETIFLRLRNICRQLASPMLEYSVVTALGAVDIIKGRLHEADETVTRALSPYGDKSSDNDTTPAPYGVLLILKGYLLWEYNALEKAEELVLKGMRLVHYIAPRNIIVYGYMILASIFLSRKNIKDAREVVQKADQYWPTAYHLMLSPELLKARIDIADGHLKAVGRWLRSRNVHITDLPEHFNEMNFYTYFTLAQYHIASGHPERVHTLLSRMADDAITGDRYGRLLEVRVLQTLAFHQGNDPENALQLAVEAVKLAEPGGYVRIFLDEGDPMQAILTALKKRPDLCSSETLRSWLDNLLARFSETTGSQSVPAEPPQETQDLPWSYQLDPLSKRELDVLDKIALGLKNQEIADMLFISVGTVKNHIHRILSKLEVENRTQAVYKARTMGLIDSGG